MSVTYKMLPVFVLSITFGVLQYANGASTKKEEEYTPIKYPGPIQDLSNRNGGKDDAIPAECKNKNFCTVKPPDYPQERFNAMFKGTKKVEQPTLVIESYGDRQGDPEDNDNCESEISYDPLYNVRSKQGDWHTVVQAPEENYVQKVRLETCKEVEGACFTEFPLAPDVVTFCKQKYTVWEFLVDDGNNGTKKIQAPLPVCCSCHYRAVDLKTRAGTSRK